MIQERPLPGEPYITDFAFEVLQLEVDGLHVVLERLALREARLADLALVLLDPLVDGARVDVQPAEGLELHVTDRTLEVSTVPMFSINMLI